MRKGLANPQHRMGEMFFKKRSQRPAAPVLHAYDDDFEQLVGPGSGLVVVDFWAVWCGPCRMMEPILDELANEYVDRRVRVVKVDTDQAPKIAAMYGIRSIPTIIFFKDGEPLFEMVGAIPKPVLQREIEEMLAHSG